MVKQQMLTTMTLYIHGCQGGEGPRSINDQSNCWDVNYCPLMAGRPLMHIPIIVGDACLQHPLVPLENPVKTNICD